MYELDENDIAYIKEKNFFSYTVVSKVKEDEKRNYFYENQILEAKGRCYCKINKGAEFNGKRCPYCHRQAHFIVPVELGFNNYYSSLTEENKYYIKPTDDGILIFNYNIMIPKLKKITDNVKEKIKINYIIDVKIGKKSKAYKHTAKNDVEIDLFDALRINTRTMKSDVDILFKDSVGLIDFLIKNKDFAKKTGSIDFLNLVNVEMPQNIKFLTYIYILSEYPAVERLVKMGFIKLVAGIFSKLTHCYNKAHIKECVKDFNSLIKDSPKGSECLTIPKYAADYLNDIEAQIEVYDIWSMIFSYQNLSKENFMKMIYNIGSKDLPIYKLYSMAELMKYGYKIEKLISYVEKQFNKTCIDCSGRDVVRYLKDYLEMCSLMEVTPDLYPSDIIAVHDNLQLAYKVKENKLSENKIRKISDNCQKYIPENENYTIVIPASIMEFVEEGKNQRNCVASYVNRVVKKQCLIFFIREVNDKESSFVTAEYSNGKLVQIKSKNNNSVYKKEILDYAHEFCKQIKPHEYHIFE